MQCFGLVNFDPKQGYFKFSLVKSVHGQIANFDKYLLSTEDIN